MNTFDQKPLNIKWTWRGLNGVIKNEIDYIIATSADIVEDV